MDTGAKKIAVMGLGKSGMAACRFFSKRGWPVFASDSKPRDPELSRELEQLEIAGEWGGHTSKIFDSEIVLVSPGILPHHPILEEARRRNIPVWPEIEAAYRFCPGPIAAVSGTNGKSTVAALAAHLMNANGWKARLAGNIGNPLLDEIGTMTSGAWAIMEVSSFQLETITEFRPRVACLITITQDHLNRHHDLKSYVEAKARILENQRGDDTAVMNIEDPVVRGLAGRCKGKVLWFGNTPGIEGVYAKGTRVIHRQGSTEQVIADAADYPLPGEHNLRNLLAAAAVCFAAGLTALPKGMGSFKALPHRLQFAGAFHGVDFWDDSKATNPDAAAAALGSFDRPVVLIGGGQDKNLDLTPLLQAARGRVKSFIALGKDNAKWLEAFSFLPEHRRGNCRRMEDAVALAFKQAAAGDVVLLSPGCASFDLFGSAEERGDRFLKEVRFWGGSS